MSLKRMLPETSMVKIIVVWLVGTLMTETGRASASTRLANAATNNANGKCRRNRDWCGNAARMMDRLENRTA